MVLLKSGASLSSPPAFPFSAEAPNRRGCSTHSHGEYHGQRHLLGNSARPPAQAGHRCSAGRGERWLSPADVLGRWTRSRAQDPGTELGRGNTESHSCLVPLKADHCQLHYVCFPCVIMLESNVK